MSYSLSNCPIQKATFVNGKVAQRLDDEPIEAAVTHVVFGDVDGDGIDDAVVVTECYSGMHADFEDEHVFTMDGAVPRLLARIDGEDGGIDGVAIKDGTVVVDRPDVSRDGETVNYQHGRVKRTVYRLDGSRMAIVGKPKVFQKHPPAPK